MTNLIGSSIGQYQIIEEIGRGGMATVYRAHQPSMGRDVAIKVLPAAFTHDPTFLKRFQREIKIAAHLQHTRILPVFDFGEYENQPYIVMAYIAGGSLEDRIQQGALPFKEATKYIEQIADGMDYLHSQGIVHRDFKPSNVMLDDQNNAYLMDFGIARTDEATSALTGTSILGTPAYMAPEVFEGGDASPMSDQYALGVTTFQMLTGHLPFEAETPVQHMRAHIEKPVPDARKLRSDLPPGVGNALARAMAKNPAHRFESARAFAQALIETDRQVQPPRRPMSALWIGVGVILIAALGLGGWIMFGTQARSPITSTEPLTPIPATDAHTPTLTPIPIPIPIIGGGTGVIGFNWNGLGYTVDANCVIAGGTDCDPTPHILPLFGDITPTFGQWSPDGKKILFVQITEPSPSATVENTHIYMVEIDSGRLIQIDPDQPTYNPVFSPDAARLAYLSHSAIYLTDVDCGTQQGSVCSLTGRLIFEYPPAYFGFQELISRWLPEDRLVVRNPERAIGGVAGFGLYTMNLQGSGFEYYANQLGSLLFNGQELIVDQSTGTQIIFNSTNRATSASSVILRLDQQETSISTSPDGRWLAYTRTADRFDPGEIMLVDLTTCAGQGYLGCQESEVQITFNEVGETSLAFSPDGQWLAFIRGGRTEVQEAIENTTYDYSVDPANPTITEIKGNFLFNLDSDIYLINLQEALSNPGIDTAHQITSLKFSTFNYWSHTLWKATNLFWQPAAGQ